MPPPAKLERSRWCRRCSKRYPPGWEHCPKCGTPAVASEQRPGVSHSDAAHIDFERRYRKREDARLRVAPVEGGPLSPEIAGFLEGRAQ